MPMLPPQAVPTPAGLTPAGSPRLRLRLAGATLAVLVPVLTLVPGAGPAAGEEGPVPPGAVQGQVGGGRLAEPGVVTALSADVPAPPAVAAESYVVADAATGEVLAAKNAHRRLRPASTLKTLTSLAVLPHLDFRRTYVATHEDAAIEGSKAGIVEGGTYSVDDLLNAVYLRSGNDATTALANAAGGVPQTVERMNTKARALGALDTTAVNPTGLDEDGQFSSAYDLALLGRAALRNATLRAYMGRTNAAFPGRMPPPGKPRDSFQLWTMQKYVLNYDGALGVKNGYTSKARFTLIAAAERGGRTVLVTLMKTSNAAWQEAAALSDWAFAAAGKARPVGALVEPLPDPAPTGPGAAQEDREKQGSGALGTRRPAAGSSGRSALASLVLLGAFLALVTLALRARVLLASRERRTPVDIDAYLPAPRREEARESSADGFVR